MSFRQCKTAGRFVAQGTGSLVFVVYGGTGEESDKAFVRFFNTNSCQVL